MRDAIEALYSDALRAKGGSYPATVPSGLTPLGWFSSFAPSAADAEPEDFAQRFGLPAALSLAKQGLALGLTAFERITVEDRPAVTVGRRNRKREFIVLARGWRG